VPNFHFSISRRLARAVTQTAEVTVEAESRGAAEEEVHSLAHDPDSLFPWQDVADSDPPWVDWVSLDREIKDATFRHGGWLYLGDRAAEWFTDVVNRHVGHLISLELRGRFVARLLDVADLLAYRAYLGEVRELRPELRSQPGTLWGAVRDSLARLRYAWQSFALANGRRTLRAIDGLTHTMHATFFARMWGLDRDLRELERDVRWLLRMMVGRNPTDAELQECLDGLTRMADSVVSSVVTILLRKRGRGSEGGAARGADPPF
jgi:hypothetical protein